MRSMWTLLSSPSKNPNPNTLHIALLVTITITGIERRIIAQQVSHSVG